MCPDLRFQSSGGGGEEVGEFWWCPVWPQHWPVLVLWHVGVLTLRWYDSWHHWDRLPRMSMPQLLRVAECVAGRGGEGQAGARSGHCWQVGWEPMEAWGSSSKAGRQHGGTGRHFATWSGHRTSYVGHLSGGHATRTVPAPSGWLSAGAALFLLLGRHLLLGWVVAMKDNMTTGGSGWWGQSAVGRRHKTTTRPNTPVLPLPPSTLAVATQASASEGCGTAGVWAGSGASLQGLSPPHCAMGTGLV